MLGYISRTEVPAPGSDRGPAEGRPRPDLHDLDHQHVAWPRAADPNGPRQRVAAERTPREDIGVRRGGPVVAVRGVARVEDDGVTRLDLESRHERVIPLVVDRLAIKRVRGGHRRGGRLAGVPSPASL